MMIPRTSTVERILGLTGICTLLACLPMLSSESSVLVPRAAAAAPAAAGVVDGPGIDTEAELEASVDRPAADPDRPDRRHLPAQLPDRRPDPRVAVPDASWTATGSRSARPASRSGCSARTAPGYLELAHLDLTRGGSDGPGRRGHHAGARSRWSTAP